MKRTLSAFVILAIGFASCNKEPQPLTKQQIKQKIDSLTAIRIKESDAQAQRDLQHRIEIEVKVKADSILNAQQQHIKDSLNKAKVGVENLHLPILPARSHALGNI